MDHGRHLDLGACIIAEIYICPCHVISSLFRNISDIHGQTQCHLDSCNPRTVADYQTTGRLRLNLEGLPGISVQVTATSLTGMLSFCARYRSSTSKHHRCSRWFPYSIWAALRLKSCIRQYTANPLSMTASVKGSMRFCLSYDHLGQGCLAGHFHGQAEYYVAGSHEEDASWAL